MPGATESGAPAAVAVPPPRRFDEIAVGDRGTFVRVISQADVDGFMRLTGDDNPVHLVADYGEGLDGPIAHGMLTASFVSTVIGTILPGFGALWLSERFDFRSPVRIGDRIEVEVVVRHLSPATQVVVLDVAVRNQHRSVVLDGEARVQVLKERRRMGDDSNVVRHAVVTGSGRGIGAAIASRLAADGISVGLNFHHDDERAQRTLDAIRENGGRAELFQADVTDPEGVASLIGRSTEAFGPVDALVNNAGAAIEPRPLAETSWADVSRHLDVHVRASFECIQAVLPGMVERGFGRIVNITSQSAFGVPPPRIAGYVLAKSALATLTRIVAAEAGPHGVTANAVAPGMVETDMTADIPQRSKMVVASQAPLRRLASISDVADVVAFLLSPAAAYVTGETVHLAGGQGMV